MSGSVGFWMRLDGGEWEANYAGFNIRRYESGLRGSTVQWMLCRVAHEPHRTLTKIANPVTHNGGWPTLAAAKAKAREIYEEERNDRTRPT